MFYFFLIFLDLNADGVLDRKLQANLKLKSNSFFFLFYSDIFSLLSKRYFLRLLICKS